MLSKCFAEAAASWVLEEQKNEKLVGGPTDLITAAIGSATFGDDFSDALASKQSSFNLLSNTKKAIANEIASANGIDYTTASALEFQGAIVDDITSLCDDMSSKLAALRDTTQRTPTYTADKSALSKAVDDLKQVRRSTDLIQTNPDEAANALASLVDEGLITQESLDEYLRNIPITDGRVNTQRVQVVRELRDRYYLIDSRDADNFVAITPDQQFDLVDEDGNVIEEVTGYEAGDISADGTITLIGIPEGSQQNLSKTITLRPTQQSKRPSATKPTIRQDVRDNLQSVEDDLSFEIWACVILDLMDYLFGLYESLNTKVNLGLYSVEALLGLRSRLPLGGIGQFGQSFGNLAEINKALNDILDPVNLVGGVLGIKGDLGTGGLGLGGNPTGRLLCDFNHEKYCTIHRSLANFLGDILADLEGFEVSLGGFDPPFDLDGIVDDLKGFFDDIRTELDKLKEQLDKLKSDLCAFVARRMRGVPKSLSVVEQLVAGIGLLLLAAPSFNPPDLGLNTSTVFTQAITQLTRAGYVNAAQSLSSGNLKEFFGLDDRSSVPAGKVADCLEEAAAKTSDAQKERRLLELSDAANSRANQTVVAQRVRQGVQNRYSTKTGTQSAIEIQKEGAEIIAGIDSE